MGCNQSRPTSAPAIEETRYQITFLLEHEIIGEFGEKIITNPLNSSSDSYKKEMKQNVYIKSIHPSILNHAKACGMMVDDFVEECLLPLRQTLLELLLEERDQVLRVGRHVGEDVEAARDGRELVA